MESALVREHLTGCQTLSDTVVETGSPTLKEATPVVE
jgi:hypothetical protein